MQVIIDLRDVNNFIRVCFKGVLLDDYFCNIYTKIYDYSTIYLKLYLSILLYFDSCFRICLNNSRSFLTNRAKTGDYIFKYNTRINKSALGIKRVIIKYLFQLFIN